jgi:hypothetical protein
MDTSHAPNCCIIPTVAPQVGRDAACASQLVVVAPWQRDANDLVTVGAALSFGLVVAIGPLETVRSETRAPNVIAIQPPYDVS